MNVPSSSTSNRSAYRYWLLPLTTLLVQSVIFLGMNWPRRGPVDWWFLSPICLVPWTMFIVRCPGRQAVVGSYLLGVSFYWVNTYYVAYITVAGYLALGVVFGLSYWLCAVMLRPLHERLGMPLTFALPVAWVSCEYLRGIGPLAFPFMFLAHGVFRQLGVIQISDVLGAYGVSFVLAMVNGFAADVLLSDGRRRALFKPLLATLAVLSATLIYGLYRLGQGTVTAGPKVAVLQGDYPLSVQLDPEAPTPAEKALRYLSMMDLAAEEEPDLFLFPESPWMMSLNRSFLEADTFPSDTPFYEAFQRFSRDWAEIIKEEARRHHTYIVIGSGSTEFHPLAGRPQDQIRRYNSALVFAPDGQRLGRYDKVVLVILGEYIPFRNNRWLHFLYRWLNSIHPFSTPDDEFSLTAGTTFTTFEMADAAGRTYRFGVPICFEDLIPRVSREFVRGDNQEKKVDFLLSISNDGWFNHGALVPQHLGVCVFRAVENRVGIARAVNTSCSGFISPTGRIYDLVNADGRYLGRDIFGYSVSRVQVDSRTTIHTRYGDWFGLFCLLASAFLYTAAVFKRTPTGGSGPVGSGSNRSSRTHPGTQGSNT